MSDLKKKYNERLLSIYSIHELKLAEKHIMRRIFQRAQREDFPLYEYDLYQIRYISATKLSIKLLNTNNILMNKMNEQDNTKVVYEINFLYNKNNRDVIPFNRYEKRIVYTCNDAVIPAVFNTKNELI